MIAPEDNITIFSRLRNGETVSPDDPEIKELRKASYATIQQLTRLSNSASGDEIRTIFSSLTGTEIDESTAIFPPIYINYGGNLSVGKRVFINFDCTFLTLGGITIEDNVYIGPKVCVLSEGHPLQPDIRHTLVPAPVHIKKNAWLGAGAIILPGITIGENAVVAAGAVVTKDVAPNTVVAGIPAKLAKEIEP